MSPTSISHPACSLVWPPARIAAALILAALTGCLTTSEDLSAALDPDGDGSPWPKDCMNSDPDAFPGAAEQESRKACMLDADGDGYGAATVDGPAEPGTDCDDEQAEVNPGSEERCDGVDNDCDGGVDEGTLATFHADDDGDGYGDPQAAVSACAVPTGFVEDASDCDDTRADVFPGAEEICGDGAVNNCDGDLEEARVVCLDWPSSISLSSADAIYLGADEDDFLGYALARVGDVDMDGVGDFLASSHGAREGAGAIYLLSGAMQGEQVLMEGAWMSRYNGVEVGDEAGSSIAALGAASDGGLWAAIGAPWGETHSTQSGVAYLVELAAGQDLSLDEADVLLYGEAGSHLGQELAPAGRFGEEQRPGVLLGAPFHGSNRAGIAYLIVDPSPGEFDAQRDDVHFGGGEADAQLGAGLAATDVDGDGVRDVWVGAYRSGSVSLFLEVDGASESHNITDADGTWLEDEGTSFGDVILPAGDVDGDGREDVALGSPFHDLDATADVGAVCLILEAATLSERGESHSLSSQDGCARLWTGWEEGQRLGIGLDAGFDADGDGRTDLLTGAPLQGETTGAAWLLLDESEPLPEGAAIEFTGDLTADLAGYAVLALSEEATGGTFNLLVGAWHAQVDGLQDAGVVYRVQLPHY